MRTVVIANAQSGTADRGEDALVEASALGYVVWRTSGAHDASALARSAVAEGFDTVVAAGGDGTIHGVLNGLDGALAKVTLAVLPLGTGNDLARTLALPDDPHEALALVASGARRAIDVIRARSSEGEWLALNAAVGGFGAQVDEAVDGELKKRWGPLAYLMAASSTVGDVDGFETYLAWDGGEYERVRAFNVVVANGRTVAGGTRVAPSASVEDGLLDVVIVQHAPLPSLLAIGARLLGGNYLESDGVSHRRVRSVGVRSVPGMRFNLDGELKSDAAIVFEVMARALTVVVGAGFDAAAAG